MTVANQRGYAVRSESLLLLNCVDTSVYGRLATTAVHPDFFSFGYLGVFVPMLYKTIQRIFQIANRLIRLTMLHRPGDTMLNMLFQDSFAHLVERSTNRRNLCQHIIAIAPFFPESLETIGMTGDTCEPFSDIFTCWFVL